ncbi:exonuclease 1 isoform X2 [Pristis pectinata]|uniref:exonuclease 1 isoform X2 n=1 Tax=Pristis pectinata TaxID=685728 RepID=UPI00223D2C02|nr:exonuclease 1 isoform X2 [Pristis pectinata]
MGIQGLLQFVKEASEPIHIKKYKGQTVALDMYCWLHKGAFACADKLAKGEPTDQRRQTNLQKGKQLLREGKTAEARECFTRCVNITPAMAHEVIKAARAKGMDCIVAPYEADAQLAYLNKIGIAQAVITEDSDLLAFGCKKVVLKVDKCGNGIEIDKARFGKCKQLGDVFTEEKFRYMCILSGCDYLPSIHGIGLAKACKLLRIANNPDIITVIKKMGQYLKTNVIVPEEYIDGFIRANNTFLYQLVFDPLKRKLVPLNDYSDGVDPKSLEYAGRHFGDEKALHIALGNIDIKTSEFIDNFNPCTSQILTRRSNGWNDNEANKKRALHMLSIWSKEYRPYGNQLSVPKAELSPEKPCTRGMEKVINIKNLKLPNRVILTKRAREDESLSDGDLLNQYKFPNNKKAKKDVEESLHPESPSELELPSDHSITEQSPRPHCKIRNRFAAILQKRNEDSGTVVVPGTRSRFFCTLKEICVPGQNTETSVVSNATEELKDSSPISSRKGEKNDISTSICSNEGEQEEKPLEILNTNPNANAYPAGFHSEARRSLSAFSWSRGMRDKSRISSSAVDLSVLQQFHRKVAHSSQNKCTDGKMVKEVDQNVKQQQTNLPKQSEECQDDNSEETNSPQSPLNIRSSLGSLNSLGSSQISTSSELDEASDGAASRDQSSSPLTLPPLPEKTVTAKHRVPGLQRLSPGSARKYTKLKLPGPAKVSGLIKRSVKSAPNNENKPELQATINDLWKKFEFKRKSKMLQPSEKLDPMSPVKDNLQILTPETDQSILLRSECISVQRAIQW